MKKFDVFEMVNNLIIVRMEKGVIPWQQPWKSTSGMPCNLVSKKPYRGFNLWYLTSLQFDRPYFLTWNQVQDLGGSVIKGSKSHPVVFWKILDVTRQDGSPDKIPYLRYYRVFHVDSVSGIESKIPVGKEIIREFNPIDVCENLVSGWRDCPRIECKHAIAAYSPVMDVVMMPKPENFFSDQAYYSTLFHEISHSTGHRSRLNRHEKFPDHAFGSKDYSQEELVAELGAAYLSAMCGIENTTIDNSAAYIKGWLSKLKNDNKFFIQAASYAQHAVDYIYGNQFDPAVPEQEKEFVPEESFSF
jgi:antirestriction protein ArdC